MHMPAKIDNLQCSRGRNQGLQQWRLLLYHQKQHRKMLEALK
jgi:hypothetical protein